MAGQYFYDPRPFYGLNMSSNLMPLDELFYKYEPVPYWMDQRMAPMSYADYHSKQVMTRGPEVQQFLPYNNRPELATRDDTYADAYKRVTPHFAAFGPYTDQMRQTRPPGSQDDTYLHTMMAPAYSHRGYGAMPTMPMGYNQQQYLRQGEPGHVNNQRYEQMDVTRNSNHGVSNNNNSYNNNNNNGDSYGTKGSKKVSYNNNDDDDDEYSNRSTNSRSKQEDDYGYGNKSTSNSRSKQDDDYGYGNKSTSNSKSKQDDGYGYGNKSTSNSKSKQDDGYGYGNKSTSNSKSKQDDGYGYGNKSTSNSKSKQDDGYGYGIKNSSKKSNGESYSSKSSGNSSYKQKQYNDSSSDDDEDGKWSTKPLLKQNKGETYSQGKKKSGSKDHGYGNSNNNMVVYDCGKKHIHDSSSDEDESYAYTKKASKAGQHNQGVTKVQQHSHGHGQGHGHGHGHAQQQPRQTQFLSQGKSVELKVPICCDNCERKVTASLQHVDGVESVLCDQWEKKVIVYGNVKPDVVLKRVRRVKKGAELWQQTPKRVWVF